MVDSSASVRFEVLKDGEVVRTELLIGPVIRVGRVAASGLRIEDEKVDPLHAIIEVRAQGKVFVTDLGSQEGTTINGTTVVSPQRIRSRDRLVFGDTCVEVLLGEDKRGPRRSA